MRNKIESKQREEARTRLLEGVEWKPRFFREMRSGEEDSDLDFIIQHTIDGATPQEQIKQILAIQPILPGSQPVNSIYTIPPYHSHNAPNATNDNENLLVEFSTEETPGPDLLA